MLLHQFLEQTARRSPDTTALVSQKTSYSYRQIDEAAARLGAAMQERGVRRGDRVAVFLDNGLETIVSVYAALKIGAVFMPINALTKTDKLAYMLNDSRAACLVTHAALRGVWDDALAHSQSVRTCIVVGDETSQRAEDRFLPYGRARADERDDTSRAHDRPGSREHHLHVGLHRRSQGGDAHPPQHGDGRELGRRLSRLP